MRHFPIFLDTAGRRVVVAGGGAASLAKLRLLVRSEARITVFASEAMPEIEDMARSGRITLVPRAFGPGDAMCTALAYAASDDDAEDARVVALARADGALVNSVDNLSGSMFITPAMVDRDPVTVAIGTEGTAPVLARKIKADLESRLPTSLGVLARAAARFRPMAEHLPGGRIRRAFWSAFFAKDGPEALNRDGEDALDGALTELFERVSSETASPGRVDLVGAGPGDPELLTLRARRLIDGADVVIHDRLVPSEIIELARREAVIVEAGKTGFGPSMSQDEINALMIEHAKSGAHVVRLKSGDPGVYGRLEEETQALDEAGIDWAVCPGITAASAAGAEIGRSLTRRGRNSALRFITGHDTEGFAEHDWRALAKDGAVTAIYMGRRGARFLQGRLLMHGADPDTPVTAVAQAGRPSARIIEARLSTLPTDLDRADPEGPVILLLGLTPHAAAAALANTRVQEVI